MHRALIEGKVLVPLDGSALAERALPAAERVAHATSSTLVLVRIVPTTAQQLVGPRDLIATEIDRGCVEDERQQAVDYLERMAASLRAHGVAAQPLVACGEPTSLLLDLESSLQVGLVVMTTHGRTGLKRFILGSVADRLVYRGHVPVLLVRPFGEEPQPEWLEQALVPLDGSVLAEAALDVATQLAGSLLQQIVLLRVVRHDADPGASARARDYLEEQRSHLAQQLVARRCTIDARVLSGDAVQHIAQAARGATCLVIMAPHGQTAPDVGRWGT